MKKILAILTAAFVMLSATACTETTLDNQEEIEKIDLTNQTWVDCETLDDAEKLAGFDFSFSEDISNGYYPATAYRAVKDKIIETTYYEEESAYTVVILQAIGENSLTGFEDTKYDYVETVKDCGAEFTMNYKDEGVVLTTLSYQGYSYVIYTYDVMGWQGIYEIISEMTGVEHQTAENNEDEPTEGAPVVEEGRYIDDKPIEVGNIAGRYTGINYGECSVSIYTSMDEFSAEVGNVEITDKDGKILFAGRLMEVMTNKYEIYGTNANFSVYTDGETVNLDFYAGGEHEDYFTMVEAYVS